MIKNKINAREGIIYSGNVHIQYQFKKKTKNIRKHNEGKLPLFSAIVSALGDDIVTARQLMPRYIMAKHKGDNDITGNCLTSKVLVQGISYYNSSEFQAIGKTKADTIRYTFVIPSPLMVPGKKINTLELLNSNDGICAEITLDSNNQISTDLGANLLIYWDLTFTDVDA